MATRIPLIVIVGPTASGKTVTAINLAKKIGGEIICADSRTIYKEMDIGTAKPSRSEQSEVPHWGIDLAFPNERFTVADFKKYAENKVTEIRSRDRVPILVGGTGLYIDSVIFNFNFKDGSEKSWRKGPLDNTIVVGIATEKDTLHERIKNRSEQMFSNGVVDEASRLGKKYSWSIPAMTGNIYPLVEQFLQGKITFNETVDKFTTLDRQLAKRQLTWFRPNPYIEWCVSNEVENYINGLIVSE